MGRNPGKVFQESGDKTRGKPRNRRRVKTVHRRARDKMGLIDESMRLVAVHSSRQLVLEYANPSKRCPKTRYRSLGGNGRNVRILSSVKMTL